MKSNPLISVITVTYNAAADIQSTIKSIINQPFTNFEYLVIDGNSTDGTQAIIEKYLDKIDIWLSEPDAGIADALNKAVNLAKGKYLIFILAGDLLIEIPEQMVNEDADVVCFPVRVTGNVVKFPKISSWLKIMNTIPHQGAFFKRTSNLKHDERYRFFCDFALCQTYYLKKLSMKAYNTPVVAFHGLNGATSNKNNFHEVFSIVQENFGLKYKLLSYIYWKYDGFLRRVKLRKA